MPLSSLMIRCCRFSFNSFSCFWSESEIFSRFYIRFMLCSFVLFPVFVHNAHTYTNFAWRAYLLFMIDWFDSIFPLVCMYVPLSCFFVSFPLWSCFDFHRCKNALPITHTHTEREQWHCTLQHRNQFMCIAWCRMNMMQIKGELTTGNYCWIPHFELMLIARAKEGLRQPKK